MRPIFSPESRWEGEKGRLKACQTSSQTDEAWLVQAYLGFATSASTHWLQWLEVTPPNCTSYYGGGGNASACAPMTWAEAKKEARLFAW